MMFLHHGGGVVSKHRRCFCEDVLYTVATPNVFMKAIDQSK